MEGSHKCRTDINKLENNLHQMPGLQLRSAHASCGLGKQVRAGLAPFRPVAVTSSWPRPTSLPRPAPAFSDALEGGGQQDPTRSSALGCPEATRT